MYTDLEKIEINFPDVSFKRALFRGYSVVVPKVYESEYQKEFDQCVNQINNCLRKHRLRRRKSSFLSPLTAQGLTKQRCAENLMDKIRNCDIQRLQNSFHDIAVTPQEGVNYFPVYNDDFFHQHGDPDFFDFSPVQCVSSEGVSIEDDFIELFSMFTSVVKPVIEPEKEVIGFQPNYGKNHCHLINSEILRDKLGL